MGVKPFGGSQKNLKKCWGLKEKFKKTSGGSRNLLDTKLGGTFLGGAETERSECAMGKREEKEIIKQLLQENFSCVRE